MLSDVLDALSRTNGIDQIVLVTRDTGAARLGKEKRAHVLWEGQSRGLNAAVRRGIRFAQNEGAHQVLIVPSDVPLARPADFRKILKSARKNEVLIVPSHDGGGTNALLLRPPSIMPVSFGRNSFKRHCRLALNRSLNVRVLKPRSLRVDVDNPSDLRRVRLASGSSRSQELLRRRFEY